MPRSLSLASAVSAGIGAVLTVLALAPARWLAEGLSQATQGQVQLVNARGTVWRGQAHLVLTGGADSRDRVALPTPVHWALSPTWLATRARSGTQTLSGLALSVQLRSDCCTPQPLQAWLQPGWPGVGLALAPHTSEWPAELLTGLGTPWNTLQLQAQLKLSTPGMTLRLGSRGLEGQGQITLDVADAASRLSTLRPMGNYRLVWQADTGTLALSTLQGALELQGSGQWIAGRLRFQGHAQASPGREEALANLMNILGRRQGPRTLITIG